MSKLESISKYKCVCVNGPSSLVDPVAGEVVCKECGIVLESKIYELNARHNELNVLQLQNRGIGTKKPELKTCGIAIKIASRPSEKEMRIARALQAIQPFLEQQNMPKNIKNEAQILARKAAANKMAQGYTINDMVTACIFAACRIHGMVLSVRNLLNATNASKRGFRIIYQKLETEFNIQKIPIDKQTITIICRVCSDLNISNSIKINAVNEFEKLKKIGITQGKNPNVVAGYSIYISSKGITAQSKIAESSNVSETSIRNFMRSVEKLTK